MKKKKKKNRISLWICISCTGYQDRWHDDARLFFVCVVLVVGGGGGVGGIELFMNITNDILRLLKTVLKLKPNWADFVKNRHVITMMY